MLLLFSSSRVVDHFPVSSAAHTSIKAHWSMGCPCGFFIALAIAPVSSITRIDYFCFVARFYECMQYGRMHRPKSKRGKHSGRSLFKKCLSMCIVIDKFSSLSPVSLIFILNGFIPVHHYSNRAAADIGLPPLLPIHYRY